MARDFDGTNDRIDFGSDASIDQFLLKTISFWIVVDNATGAPMFLCKDGASSWQCQLIVTTAKLRFRHAWSGAAGVWEATTTTFVNGTRYHVVITYDTGATGNDPAITINGAAEVISEIAAPSGTLDDDSGRSLLFGENAGGGNDCDGRLQHLAYDNAIWSAAEINRARWWGRPRGGLKVYHPFLTTKLANEGTATATGTATGTSVASFATPVQRPGSALMGMGCGW